MADVTKGKIYGVGVGPGDPELLTLKAVRIIEEADVIAFPMDNNGKSVAYDIAQKAVNINDKEVLGMNFPMTRDKEELERSWENITDWVEKTLNEGKNIAFLSLGDVSLYSTWGYLRDRIRERGFETDAVAGVTAMCATAARLGRSLTGRDEPLIIIPASVSDSDMEELLKRKGGKVVMKSGQHLNEVIAKLEQDGRADRSGMVINCGMSGEQIYTSLEDTKDAEGYFATILVK
ncbi:MAG: precorrin-2 C(20)-methyltransferase [Lachnospiraceae bacterium]|nr:precorrin-2 C(20)-methyltransferase [Lachnospiraceae bacterium]